MPLTVWATVVSGTGDGAALVGASVPLSYSPTDQTWRGDAQVVGGADLGFQLVCALFVWFLNPSVKSDYPWAGEQPAASTVCPPALEIDFGPIVLSPPRSGTINVVVTQ